MRSLPLGLALAGLTACGGQPGEVPAPRSLLVVTIDTTRADHIGCYGYEAARTPVIDGLAAQGVRFDACFSVAPITFPSHVSLMTGTVPPYHGVRDNGTHRAVPELLTLAEILGEEGFQTAAFTAAYVLDEQFGLDQGFQSYEGIRHKVTASQGMVEERSAAEVNASVMRWIDHLAPDRPFFLWVHYFEPHHPYPPAAELPPGMKGRPYDAEINTADRELGKLLAHLATRGRRAETLVVVTSDHGESLGEHGEASHSFFTYQGTLHVPLIFAHASLPGGLVVEDKVSLVDVFPTALELLGIEPPIQPPPSRSLAPAFAGADLEDRPAYFESLSSYLNYGWAPIQGVAVGERKLIHVPRGELYDWRADPRELKNLFDSEPEVSARLLDDLERLLEANEPPERASSAERELTSADRAALASLGYTGAASDGDVVETLADPKDGIERIRREEEVRAMILGGRHEEGARLLKEMLEEDPDNAIFNAHYGFLQLSRQNPAVAIPYLKKSLDLGFRTADNYSNLGISYLMTGNAPRARDTLLDALVIDNKNLTALFWLARAQLELGARDEARRRFEEFLGLWHGGDEDPMVLQAREDLRKLKQG